MRANMASAQRRHLTDIQLGAGVKNHPDRLPPAEHGGAGQRGPGNIEHHIGAVTARFHPDDSVFRHGIRARLGVRTRQDRRVRFGGAQKGGLSPPVCRVSALSRARCLRLNLIGIV